MSKYIDDKKAEILDTLKDINYAYNDCSMYDTLERLLNEMTADVVEVVRCKDCSNWDRHWISSLFSENVHYCAFIDGPCNGDFYCKAAVKRQVLGGDTH